MGRPERGGGQMNERGKRAKRIGKILCAGLYRHMAY